MSKKTIILVSTALAVIVTLFALWSRATKGNDELNNRNQNISNMATELNTMKYNKEQCLNDLSYADSIRYNNKDVVVCNEWDNDIERLTSQLNAILLYESDYVTNTDTEEDTKEWEPWKLTEDGTHQKMPTTTWTDSHERFKQIAQAYGLDAWMIWDTENHYWIKEGVILCIAIAETSGWKFWAGINNIGNVWNTDTNPRWQSYWNVWASLDAIGRTLNNGYLWSKKTLACLSNAGDCIEEWDNGKRYASSQGNRQRNNLACLSAIYWAENVTPQFNIRR